MAVTKSLFGKSPEGKEISLYTLSNSKGMKAAVTDLGATLVRVLVPDAAGKADDLVLGFDNGECYYGNDSFFGTVIGPLCEPYRRCRVYAGWRYLSAG